MCTTSIASRLIHPCVRYDLHGNKEKVEPLLEHGDGPGQHLLGGASGDAALRISESVEQLFS